MRALLVTNVLHPLALVLLAKEAPLSAGCVECWPPLAAVMRTPLTQDVLHAPLSVLLTPNPFGLVGCVEACPLPTPLVRAKAASFSLPVQARASHRGHWPVAFF